MASPYNEPEPDWDDADQLQAELQQVYRRFTEEEQAGNDVEGLRSYGYSIEARLRQMAAGGSKSRPALDQTPEPVAKPKPMDPLREHAEKNIRTGALADTEDGPASVRSGSVEHPALNDGQPTLIPFQWDGQILGQEEATQRAIDSGKQWPAFQSNEEATAASKQLSDSLGAKDIPALEQAAKDVERTDWASKTDHIKGVAGSFMRLASNGFNYWATAARQDQYEQLERYEQLYQDSPEKGRILAEARAKVEAGDEIDPSFYGTFVKPLLEKDGVSPAQRIAATTKELLDSRTPETLERARKPFFFEEGMDGFEESQMNFNAAKPSTWFDGTAMPWEDLDAFLLGVSQNTAQLATTAVAAMVGARSTARYLAGKLRGQGIVNPNVVREQTAAMAAKAGAVTAHGVEYVMIRDEVAAGVKEALEARNDDEELWAKNDDYRELRDQGYSDVLAKQVVTDEISRLSGQVGGVASSILGAPMNAFWAKLGLAKAASRSGAAVQGALGETVQEAFQETSEQLISNIGESRLDPNHPWTKDLKNAFFSGAALGFGMGGPMGALGGGDVQVALNKDQKDLNKKGFAEWRKLGNERSALQAKLRNPKYIETTPAEQRVQDFERLEDIEYRESKAFLKAEKKIRSMQRKYGSGPQQNKRTDVFSTRAKATINNIEEARKDRSTAEERASTERELAQERDAIIEQVETDATQLADLKDTQTALQEIQQGGVLAGDVQYQELIDQGYGRWTSKAKTKFLLTPAGRSAQESLNSAIRQVEGKIEAGYGGVEKRKNPQLREEMELMSAEELEQKIYTDPKTGGKTERAYEDIEKLDGPAGAYASIDVDSLGWLNDSFGGHEKGNELLRKLVKAARTEGVDLYRVGGDEFIARGEPGQTEADVEDGMKRIAERLRTGEPITDIDKSRTFTPAISWATAETYEAADQLLPGVKQERVRKGQRVEKTEDKEGKRRTPPGVKVIGQLDLPLMSLDVDAGGATEINAVTEQIARIRQNKDTFSQRRMDTLSRQLIELRVRNEEPGLDKLAQELQREMTKPLTIKQAQADWATLSQDEQQVYEQKANEYYTPMAGAYVTPMGAYVYEQTGKTTASWEMPSPYQDVNGNDVKYEQSAEYERLGRLIGEGNLPPALTRALEREARQFRESGMENATPVHALSLRTSNYNGGLRHMHGPSPFSGNVTEFARLSDLYSANVKPLTNATQESDSTFYKSVRKGDQIEVVVDGESIMATVSSETNDTFVARWDIGPTLNDPDTKQMEKSARFSRRYGWQVSARMARGGKPYKNQAGSWPKQARLGKRWNSKLQTWETAQQDHGSRQKVLIAERRYVTYPRLQYNARTINATKQQMGRARLVTQNLLRGYRNLPNVSLANTIADLPDHMQKKLTAHGSTGFGVYGMFDEVNPKNGVWILVGNIADNAAGVTAHGKTFETLVAEAVAHETVGHYGLRGFMGSDQQMGRWMDAITRAFPDKVQQKATSYGLGRYSYKDRKYYFRSEEARRIAAEEVIAETAQYLIANTPGYTLSKDQKNIFDRIVNYIRGWLIDHGFGQYISLTKNDIYNLIQNAQNFANNGKGWEYRIKTGQILTPYMRDADIFRNALLTEFNDGMRSTNSQERKQMKQRGLEPLAEVPMFGDMTKANLLQTLKKGVSDGRFKQGEIDFTNVDSFIENITWGDFIEYGKEDAIPPTMQAEIAEASALAGFDWMRWEQKKEHLIRDMEQARKMPKGRMFGVDWNAETARTEEALRVYDRDRPTEADVHNAQVKLDELKSRPITGKKTKIPKEVVSSYLAKTALQVQVRPGREYDIDAIIGLTEEEVAIARERGVDINPQNWDDVRPRTPEFSDYIPRGVDRATLGVYVFAQTAPAYRGQIGHNFHPPESMGGNTSTWAHLRYATGTTLEGLKAYEIVETQSDTFQGKDNAPTSSEEVRELERVMVEGRKQLKDGGHRVSGVLADEIMKTLMVNYNAVLEGDVMIGEHRYGQVDDVWPIGDKRQRLREVQMAQYDQWRIQINESLEEISKKIGDWNNEDLWQDDARAFDYLDALAVQSVMQSLRNRIAYLVDYTYDPGSVTMVGLEGEHDYHKEFMSYLASGFSVDDSVADEMARVMGRPHLLKQVMDVVFSPVQGGKTFDAADLAKLTDSVRKGAERQIVTIPRETHAVFTDAGLDIKEQAAERYSAFRSMGWGNPVDWLWKTMDDGSFEITASRQRDSDVSFAEALQANLADQVQGEVAVGWARAEDRRIKKVQQEIGRIQQGDGGQEVGDIGAALDEIEWDQDTHDPELEDEMIDRDRFIERKANNDITYLREAGEIRDWLDNADIQMEDNNGVTLDREHPRYRERISVDEDGDADTSEAEQWLREEIETAGDDYFDINMPGWESIREDAASEWDNNSDYQDTEVKTFEIPVEWDEDGDVIETIEGYVIMHGVSDEDSVDSDSSGMIHTTEPAGLNAVYSHDYAWHWSDVHEKVAALVFATHKQRGVTPPVESQFYQGTNANEAPQDLKDQLARADTPDFDVMAGTIRGADFKTEVFEEELDPYPQIFDRVVRAARKRNIDIIEATPFRDNWQTVLLRFSIADAIRKGHDTIIWQSGEASTGRGGWQSGGEWTTHDHVDWHRTTQTIQGKETEVYVITTPDRGQLILTPDRLVSVLGGRTSKEIQKRAEAGGDGETKHLQDRYRIVPLSDSRFVVMNRDTDTIEGDIQSTALGAETRRMELIQQAREDSQGEPTSNSGRVTSSEMGGMIALAPATSMSMSYRDTVMPSGHIRGARMGYDVILPSIMRKLIRSYGGKVEEGVKVIPQDQIEEAVVRDGAQLSYEMSKEFAERYPNLRIEEIPANARAAGAEPGHIVVSDKGLVWDEIFPNREQAQLKLQTLLEQAREEVKGLKVYEVKITDAMREEFGQGGLPIMSAAPNYRQEINNFSSYDMSKEMRKFKREHSAAEWTLFKKNLRGLVVGGVTDDSINTYLKADKGPSSLFINGQKVEDIGNAMLQVDAAWEFRVPRHVDRDRWETKRAQLQEAAKGKTREPGQPHPASELAMRKRWKDALHPSDPRPVFKAGERLGIGAERNLEGEPRTRDPRQLPLMSRDPIAGNAILEEFAKKVGQSVQPLTPAQRWDEFRKDIAARVNQGLFDRFYGIKYAMKQTNWQGPAEKDPYMAARLTTSLDSQMRAVMNYGHPIWKDGIMEVEGKGLLDILGQIGKPEQLRAWSLFMVARRSERLKEEGREQLVTDEEIKEGLKLGDQFPIFRKVADEYAEFNKKVLDFAEKAGVIDSETRPAWEHADYVPFYRVQDDRITGPMGAGMGIANQAKPIKRLKGGEAALADIPTNILQNVTRLIDSANKNAAALLAVDALKGTGTMTKVPSLTAETAMVPMGQVKKALVEAGLKPDQIPEAAMKGMQKMFVMTPNAGEGVITVLRDGKREYYQTSDRLLWESMTMLNGKTFGRWINLFRAPKRFLTATVTLDPGFMMANYLRDLGSSYIQSRDVNSPFTHMARSLQGWKQAVAKDESLRTMMSAGAAFDSGYLNYGDPNSTHRAIRKAMRKQGFRKTVLDGPARIFDLYKEFGASFENANRIAVYNEAIANGRSKKQAAFEAKDLMDFSMGGSWGAVQFLIQTVPFFGARLQGLHRVGRGFADNPVAFTMKGLLMSMASMAVFLAFQDDERYKELEEWDKDTYIHFWLGGQHYRLPKPFEVGALFMTIPERAWEYWHNDADDADKLVMRRFAHMLGETFAFNPIPQVVGPMIESAFNHNFFTGRQIVSPYEEDRIAPEQYRSYTSPSAVELARSLPEGLDVVSKKYRSPLYLENLYRGYTGTLGRYVLMGMDELMRDAMDYPAKPSMRPGDYPVLGRFFRGPADAPRRTKYEEGFYDLLRKTKEIKGSMRFLEKVGSEERLELIEADKAPYVGLAEDLEKARREISAMNAESMEIHMDPDATPDEKRRDLDALQEGKNEIYKAIWEERPGAGPSEPPTEEDLTFLLDRFGVDEVAVRLDKNAPATADLLRDVATLDTEQRGALSR